VGQKDTLKRRLERLGAKESRSDFARIYIGCDPTEVSRSPQNLPIFSILKKLRLKGYPRLMIPVEFVKMLFIKGYRQVWNEILEEKRPPIASWGHGQGPFERCHSIAARRMIESRNTEGKKRG
jgi:hypothetical protein